MRHQMDFDSTMTAEYDRGIRRTLPTYDQLFRIVHAYLHMELADTSCLLIDGAGGGTELTVFGRDHPHWSFTAVDLSESMLQLAKQKAEQVELTNHIQFILGTPKDVSGTSFDAATSMLVLHFIEGYEEKLAHLQAIRKRLKTGAPFVLAAVYGDKESAEFQKLYQIWKAYWLHTTNLSAEKVEDMGTALLSQSILPEEDICFLLGAAGFGQITNFFKTNLFGAWVCRAE